jgi:MoaA/NifB/PqqE/SkfB family radical SAM enzyme
MSKLYKIETVNNILVVDWILSNVCNYKCSYCGPDSNGGDQYWPDIENCEIAIKKITEQSKHDHRIYTILGGEPTVWKNFTKLAQLIKENDPNSMVNILTNGSRTMNWWNKTKPFLDKVSISFHHENANVDHIIDVVNNIKTDCQTNIQILMDINYFDKCVKIFETFRDNTDVPIQIKKLQIEFGKHQWMLYTEDQKKLMMELHLQTSGRPASKRNKTSLGINCFYDDGTVIRQGNHELIQKGLNNFYNWKCNIGQDLLVIKPNGNIIPANACNNNIILGNIKNDPESIKLLTESVICKYKECTCGSDIEITKIAH